MSQDALLLLLFKITLIAGEAAALLWVAVYSYLANWRANPIGATVTRFALYLAAVYVPSILSLFFHLNRQTSRAAGWFDIAVFAVIAAELLHRIPLWVRMHMDKDGHQSYEGLIPFFAQVIRRRGRPVWKDDDAPAADEEALCSPGSPPHCSSSRSLSPAAPSTPRPRGCTR